MQYTKANICQTVFHSLSTWVFYSQVCNELINQGADLDLYGAGIKFAHVLFILVLEQLHLCSAFLQRRPQADDLIQLVAHVGLAVPQLLLQQRDLARLLAHLCVWQKRNYFFSLLDGPIHDFLTIQGIRY